VNYQVTILNDILIRRESIRFSLIFIKDLNPDNENPMAANKAKSKQAVPAGAGGGANDVDADLEARLDALRRQ
jgi:hypothetical protein